MGVDGPQTWAYIEVCYLTPRCHLAQMLGVLSKENVLSAIEMAIPAYKTQPREGTLHDIFQGSRAHGLTLEEFRAIVEKKEAKMREAFREFDTNADGHIDEQEVLDSMKRMNFEITHSQVVNSL